MKNLWAVMAILFAFTFTVAEAEAKKFGGGKSFGKSFKTAPANKPIADNKNNANQPANAQNLKSNSKKGLMGGLLGGLLAGGLIGALLGGAFEGIQFMDILIIGLIAFVAYKLFKGMSQAKASSLAQPRPAYADSGSQQFRTNETPADASGPASFGGAQGRTENQETGEEVPLDLPPGFDVNGFLAGSCDHYRTLQEAWNKADFDIIAEYTSPSLGEELIAERKTLEGEQNTEVMFLDADLVRAHQVFGTAQVSIKFSGRYKDNIEGIEEDITDIWHLERDLKEPNAPWFIIGIEN